MRKISCVLFGFVLASALGATNAAAAERPNVVFILTDDQGWFDLGVYGNPHIETPVIDRLAAESVRFSRFYASPVCTPTRAALLTGRYPPRTGAIDTYLGRDTMAAGEITLGQVFQERGYRTAIVGKWHLGRYMKYHPNLRGFDEFFGFWQYGFINRYFDPDQLFDNRTPVTTIGYVTDVLTDRAISFLEANHDRPFFLYVPYNAPHSPYQAPEDLLERYLAKGLPLREAQIYAMITRIDQNVGRLLETIDRLGLRENTIVIFMTDNGGVSTYFKAGLRGNKGSVYEGGIRVPFIARWPDHFPAGRVVDVPAQHIDVFPTLCELIGAPALWPGLPTVPPDRTIDGRSILPLLRGEEAPAPHEFLFHQWTRTRPRADENWAVHHGQHKLVNGELYDLSLDPGEEHDIAAEHPDIVQQLRSEFERWFADVTAGQTYERVPIEVGRDDENPVEIDITWGEPVGTKVKPTYRSYHRDSIDNWSEVSDSVRWKIDVVKAGRYEVVFDYGCDPRDAGSRFRISVGKAHLDGVTEATASREVFRPLTIGTIDLPAGPAVLEIKPLSIPGRELMALHKIWLERVPEVRVR